MKRGMSGRTRRGPPAAGRQRMGLRIVQGTMAATALFTGRLAYLAWMPLPGKPRQMIEFTALVLITAGLVAATAWMGFGNVRGLHPPSLD